MKRKGNREGSFMGVALLHISIYLRCWGDWVSLGIEEEKERVFKNVTFIICNGEGKVFEKHWENEDENEKEGNVAVV